MKTTNITYWITTAIVTLMMLFSAYNYLTADAMKQAFTHLGYPDYFRIELAVAKIIGALILIIPGIPKYLKVFAYVGFTITFISAFIAHIANGDPMSAVIAPLIFLLILGISFYTYEKKNRMVRH